MKVSEIAGPPLTGLKPSSAPNIIDLEDSVPFDRAMYKGQKWKEGAIPPNIIAAKTKAFAIPESLLQSLPTGQMPISEFRGRRTDRAPQTLPLQQLNSLDFRKDQPKMTDEEIQSHYLPALEAVKESDTHVYAWLEGANSIKLGNDLAPLHIVTFWTRCHEIEALWKHWDDARQWAEKTFLEKPEKLSKLSESFDYLPADVAFHSLSAQGTTAALSRILGTRRLNDENIDQMTAWISKQLTVRKAKVLITNAYFTTLLLQCKDSGKTPHTPYPTLVKEGQIERLYIPAFEKSQKHWTAFCIDFQQRCLQHGMYCFPHNWPIGSKLCQAIRRSGALRKTLPKHCSNGYTKILIYHLESRGSFPAGIRVIRPTVDSARLTLLP
jgi:hypothetical protein